VQFGWDDVHALAARAGVEPWNYNLHELVVRWEAVQMEAWNQTAWLAMHSVAPWSRGRLKFDDFHPVLKRTKAARQAGLKQHLDVMRKEIAQRGDMTFEQADAFYNAAYRRQNVE
jgi:hypothetical protein